MRAPRFLALILLSVCLAGAACRRSGTADVGTDQTAATARTAATAGSKQPAPGRSENDVRRDLSVDESMGGHTLARHVGRTDAELARRLGREQISAASTYSDRDAAEHAVGAALRDAGRRLSAWRDRSGRRPNLVLHYVDRSGTPVGRTLFRGDNESVPCDRALVVLRWDERSQGYYVLTSYPDCTR